MKVRTYMRVARKPNSRGKAAVAATTKPTAHPLADINGPLPTVYFAIEFDIPDSLLDRAQEVIAEIKVDGRKAKIAAEIETP